MKTNPFFSIVVPALNEERYLPLLLKDLSEQTFDHNNFEVIVVDGSSDDETIREAEKFQKKLNLKTLPYKKRNVSYQRNQGAKNTQGKWIIFMDADNRLPKYFLDGIKNQLSSHPEVKIFTTWINADSNTSLNIAIARMINVGLDMNQTLGKNTALGALIGCHKKVIAQVAFTEGQKVFEDSFFIQDAVKRGFRFGVFREPRFTFSLRRLRKEGIIKMVGTVTMLQIKYLQGGDFSTRNFGYDMLGGRYYDSKSVPFLEQMKHFIKTASKKQLQQAKATLLKLTEY